MKIEITAAQVRRALPWTVASVMTVVAVGAVKLATELADTIFPYSEPKAKSR